MQDSVRRALTSKVSRGRAQDLLSTLTGLASLTLYKLTAPHPSGGMEYAALTSAILFYVMSCPGAVRDFPLSGSLRPLPAALRPKPLVWTFCLFISVQASLILSILALDRLLLSDQRALGLVSTVTLPLVSYYVLDSDLDPRQILLLPSSFVGVVLLCRPVDILRGSPSETYAEQLLGVALAIVAALCHSTAMTVLRMMEGRSLALAMSLPSVLVWASVTWIRAGPSLGCRRGCLLAGCGALGATSLLLRQHGHSRGRVNRWQATLGVLDLTLAYAVQYSILNMVPHWTNLLGTVVVAASALCSVLCGTARRGTPSLVGSQFSVIPSRKTSTSTQPSCRDVPVSSGSGIAVRKSSPQTHSGVCFTVPEEV